MLNKQCAYKNSQELRKEREGKTCFSCLHQIAFERYLPVNATSYENT